MATRLALVTGANGGIGSAICDRLRENGFQVRTMDAVEPCDVLAELAVDPIPDAPARSMSAEQCASWRYQVWRAGWASKDVLQGMIRTVAIENCALGITANCVLPGFIATPGLLTMPESKRNRMLAAIPSERFGRPDEVANVVAFLARDDARYIAAQEICIAGGLELNTCSIVGTNRGTSVQPGSLAPLTEARGER
jgi:NAD(P)-dependent dehydrogenase (short-subunit alcohol dehydrogenase family)